MLKIGYNDVMNVKLGLITANFQILSRKMLAMAHGRLAKAVMKLQPIVTRPQSCSACCSVQISNSKL